MLIGFNENFEFDKLTAGEITEATTEIIGRSKTSLGEIYAVKTADRTFENTMLALDDLVDDFSTVYSVVYLMSATHADSTIRAHANESNNVFAKFVNELNLDEKLYRAVKDYAATAEAKALSGYKKKFVEKTITDFERNGFALSKEDRGKLKNLQDQISELGLEFNKNIAEYSDFLIVTEEETKGLPEDYKQARKQEDGTYKIDLSYPSYLPFMRYCESGDSRKALMMKYLNRAADRNLQVLNALLQRRLEMAKLLGYETYAAYQLGDRMAKTPAAVWGFENNLVDQVKQKAKLDYEELLQVKRDRIDDPNADVINYWEASYYRNILLKEKYEVDNEKIKEYFELNGVLNGLFQITQHLFKIEFEEVEDPKVWHEDVRMFNVKRDGKLISRFYLDLHPRANKYGHAACFGMVAGKMTENGYQAPMATLVCNFPRATEDTPALMPHDQVETFFHEFGHVLHNMLTTSKLSSFAGTNVARDFVEAPSQIFENWCWNYEALSKFARHYKTDELLPKKLFDKMVAAKNVGSGLATSQQIFYGMIDMTLHDKFDPNGSRSTTDVVKELQNKVTLYPYVDGTNMQAAFGHLNGYAAGYYGYLWSEVYAQDMFSVFEKNGVMDQKTGIRYRDGILAKGSTQDELELVKQFLNREPNQKAFLKSLGLEINGKSGS